MAHCRQTLLRDSVDEHRFDVGKKTQTFKYVYPILDILYVCGASVFNPNQFQFTLNGISSVFMRLGVLAFECM